MLNDIFDKLAAESAQTRELQPRELLFRQGEPARHLFVVEAGYVKLARYLESGKIVLMHVARAGETFAEAALFSEIYHCNALVDVKTRVRAYRKRDILNGLSQCPEMLVEYAARLSRHVQKLRTQLELRSVHSARKRLLQFLLLEAEPVSLEFELHAPLKDLAANLGLAHETLYREMAKLEDDGIVARHNNVIKILKNDDI